MKVLFLSNEYRFELSGSAYSYRLHKLRCAIEKHGIQTEFLSLREQPFSRPILAHPLNLPFIHKKISDSDFIHAGGDAAYTAAFLKPYTKTAVIYDVHGDTLSEARLKWQARCNTYNAHMLVQAWFINTVAFRHADYFLAVSKPMQQWLMAEKHISAKRIGLIRNGVDLKLFTPQSHNTTNGFVVCYAGGFDDWQGIENLVKAFELLPNNHIRLKIIGFTERHHALKSSIAERLDKRVELVNKVTQKELIFHLAPAHVLIIPRFSHRAVKVALPTKFAEYLALGKPVIVCNVDETADLANKHHCGLVCEPSVTGLAESIQKASNLPPVALQNMGKNGRCFAESEFSWDVIGRKYTELLTNWSAPK